MSELGASGRPLPASTPEEVIEYFSARAADYHTDSLRWPWSSLRRRESAAVMKLIGDVTGHFVLDLGCGAGFYTRLMLDRGAASVCAVDIAAAMVERLPRNRVTRVVADAATVDLEPRFERIVAAGMLEFSNDPHAVMRNAHRLSAPAAVMVVLVPDNNLLAKSYSIFHRRHRISVRLFSGDDLQRLALNAGWCVVDKESVPPFTIVARLVRGSAT